jgi:hypothetical protein
MGILDDAIREHLELKRRHGADEDELQELEDSAFGLPDRPGEEEIEALAEAEPDEATAPEPDETTVMGADEGYEPEAGQELEPEQPFAAGDEEDLSPAEQARQEYPQLQDTAPHEPVAGPEPVQSTEEQDALEIGLFESEDAEEDFDVGEIDLDLGEAEIEDDAGAPEAAAAEIVDPDPTDESVIGGEGHDMLEDTPDFLKDAPESDEMWFEQDEPEDFDFD